MPKKRAKRNRATEGYAFEFHGSYSNKAKAKAKAKKRKGFVVSRKISGQRGLRYVVMTERAPF
jgi:hypothetical protein